jgi:gamma-glutamylcyclotransferase (GGCT)/AIG2-like uncharacterized protein YtfP
MQQSLTIDDRGLMTDYLFVYGTLKPEVAPAEIAAVMRQLRSLGSGTIRGFLYDLGEYPGVRLDSSGGEVEGEIVEFNDAAILKPLDAYEGYYPEAPGKSLFVRRRCHAYLKEGNLFSWVYEYNRQPPSSRQISTWPPRK